MFIFLPLCWQPQGDYIDFSEYAGWLGKPVAQRSSFSLAEARQAVANDGPRTKKTMTVVDLTNRLTSTPASCPRGRDGLIGGRFLAVLPRQCPIIRVLSLPPHSSPLVCIGRAFLTAAPTSSDP